MRRLLALFDPAPHIEEIKDESVVKKTYQYWRIRTFYSMFIGYAFYYFTRKSFTFAMPAMILDLHYTKSELGILASIMAIAYGVSKFTSGVFADRSNPRYFMAIGLMLTGVLNICFGLSSTLWLFAIFWGLNGWFQGFGWPPCARYLTHWYSQSERGRWWAMWNTSHNIGASLIPLIAAFCVQMWGWRFAMYVPGILCIGAGFFLINRLRDTPQSLGLPPIEKYRNDYVDSQQLQESNEELSARDLLYKYVLCNKWIWLLAIANFFVYFIRTAINDWSVLYLIESKRYSQWGAGGCIFWFEMGGFLGSLAAGWASDKLFGGKRGPINVIFSILIIGVLSLFSLVPAGNVALDTLSMFGIGFLIFGPQMLVGVAAVELSHKKAAATASGFTGLFGYLGAAMAGYPLGKITQDWGWEGYFITTIGCAVVGAILLLPLWGVKGFKKAPAPKPASSPSIA